MNHTLSFEINKIHNIKESLYKELENMGKLIIISYFFIASQFYLIIFQQVS